MINSGVSSIKDNSVNVQKKKFFFNNEPPNQNSNFKSINNIIKPEKINININNNININHDNNNNYNKNNDFNKYNNSNDFKNYNNNYTNSNHSKKISNNNKIINNNETNQKKKITLPDNSTYEGYLKNNEFDGYGELRTKNYNYFGEFSLGKKHGEGRLEDLVKNVEYKGTFVNNMKEGYGEERYKDGSIYKGQFKENMKHGKGIILLQGDGNYGYEGDFKEDKISGKGKFKWNSKKEYIGEWENNEISGYGILLEDKIRHIGFFSHDVKQGYGATFSIEKSFVLLGKWENDLIEGPSILLNLPDINEDNINFDNEIIVGMFKGEIINMSLDEEDLFKFKNSQDYQNINKLYKEKFFPDYCKYVKENSIF